MGAGGLTLMVASTGGHLKELHRLAPRLSPPAASTVWVTNDTAQSRALLAGEQVLFVPYQGSRNVRVTLANARRALRILGEHRPARVVSTGSGIALAFLPLARARGAACHYIESGTRVRAPSVTGRALRRVPGVRCYAQHEGWGDPGWHYAGSVLDGFSVPRSHEREPAIERVAVVLGTWRQGFRRLLERLVAIVPPGVEALWQTGFTDVDGLPIEAHRMLSPERLAAWLREADAVVTHAGMGATLDALEAGHCPVVIPRRQAAGEQIDDHQLELAAELDRRGLALARLPDEIGWDDVVDAARRRVEVTPVADLPPFRLG